MKWLLLMLITILAMIAIYVLVLRPFLKALPALKAFYAEADTFWAKVKALGWNSLTIAWSYVLAAAGAALGAIGQLGDALGDPALKDQIAAAIGDTTMTARVLLVVAAVTFLARLRSLRTQP